MLFRTTYARYRIRHGIRHTKALAGRRHRPYVSNERLRYILIGYARVSKADGSQSLDLQRDALRAEGIEASAGATSGSGPTPPAGRRARRPLVWRLVDQIPAMIDVR